MHSAGIIHRVSILVILGMNYNIVFQDLKPSNIAVNEDCELRVKINFCWLTILEQIFFGADIGLWFGKGY